FCGAMREALATMPSLSELQALWARNAATITQLRAILPELKTGHGVHYVDVLEKLYEQHGAQHASSTKEEGEAERATGVANTVFLIPHPRRSRDASHLQLVG